MQKAEFLLADSFDVSGRWWLPDKPDEKIYGTFLYEENSARLELIGTFETITLNDMMTVGDKYSHHPCFHGLGVNGEKLTLFHPIVTNHTMGQNATTTYSVRSLLVGTHAVESDAVRIKTAWLRCDHLDKFIGAGVWEIHDDTEGKTFKGMTVRYVQPDPVKYRIEAINTTLAIGVDFGWTPAEMKQVLRAGAYAEFTPDDPQNVDWSIKTAWRFCYLLTLLTNETVSPTSFRVLIDGEDHPVWLLYRKVRHVPVDDERVSPILLLYLGNVMVHFSAILDKWFSVSAMLLDGIHLFMDSQRNRHASIETRFLSLAQALEVISRSTTASEYMTKEEFKDVAGTICNAIPQYLDKHHKRSLIARIGFLYEYSLKKRVLTLLGTLSEESQRTVCKKPKDFADGVANSRNYLTHYTDELRDISLHGGELLWLSERLALLLRIALFKYLGIDEVEVVKRLNEHPNLSQTIFLARQQREHVPKPRNDDHSGKPPPHSE